MSRPTQPTDLPPESEWPAGFVPKKLAEFRVAERTYEQAEAIRGLKTELTTLQQAAKDFPTLKKELEELRQNVELDATFRAAGFGLDGLEGDAKIEKERIRARLRLLHDADNAGLEADKRLSFGDWLKTAGETDPLVKMLLPSPAAEGADGTPGAAGAGGGSGAQRLPMTPLPGAGAQGLQGGRKMTTEQVKEAAAKLRKEGKHDEARSLIGEAARGNLPDAS